MRAEAALPDRMPWLVAGLVAVVSGAAVVGWALFHQVREVGASRELRCGDTVLEVRRVYEQTGHTPLSYGREVVRIGPPGSSPPETRPNRTPVDGLAPEGLPERVETAPPGDGTAWTLFAPDPAHHRCLAANLDVLRAVLGRDPDEMDRPPGFAAAIVVWAGTDDDVWPAFRDPDGTVLRVRRDGRIEVERALADGGLSAEAIGLLYRDADGARARVLTGDEPPIVARAMDLRGRTFDERFPARRSPPEPWEAIAPRVPKVPLETRTR